LIPHEIIYKSSKLHGLGFAFFPFANEGIMIFTRK